MGNPLFWETTKFPYLNEAAQPSAVPGSCAWLKPKLRYVRVRTVLNRSSLLQDFDGSHPGFLRDATMVTHGSSPK